jgi:hypothetical protein
MLPGKGRKGEGGGKKFPLGLGEIAGGENFANRAKLKSLNR